MSEEPGRTREKRIRKAKVKSKRGRGTFKQPVFGILCRGGKIFAEIVEGVGAKDLGIDHRKTG